MSNYYKILHLSQDAPQEDIKPAYRRVILALHPDKAKAKAKSKEGDTVVDVADVDIALIKSAYRTLSDPVLRAEYDEELRNGLHQWGSSSTSWNTFSGDSPTNGAPRPAEVISLDDFTVSTLQDGGEVWTYSCRCGAEFRLTERDLEAGKHLVACEMCSEVVFVGYEEVEGEGEESLDGMNGSR
jgi:diphthamide biosynthesis protein 4